MSTVLISGASSGIGQACAEIYAKNGFDLILLARRLDRLESIQKHLKEKYRGEVHVFKADVQDYVELERLFSENQAVFNRTEILINNAGLAKGFDSFQDGKLSDWNEMIDTNIKGVLHLTKLCLPRFIKNNLGHIIMMGSVAGFVSYPKGNIYCATKAALKQLTETLRLDLMGTAIRVSEISPGMVETEFSLVRFNDEKKAKAVYQGMTPLQAQDIAETIYWVTSRPAHVNIQEMLVYSTDQASPNHVFRKSL